MSALAEKIRKAREIREEVGGHIFVLSRPTDLDMLELRGQMGPRQLLRFVVGWEKVTSLDMFPGGDGAPVPFEPEACAEWLADRPDLVGPLVERVLGAYSEHVKQLADLKKN